jgi:hypothetical protein
MRRLTRLCQSEIALKRGLAVKVEAPGAGFAQRECPLRSEVPQLKKLLRLAGLVLGRRRFRVLPVL